MPSKTWSILATGTPIIASFDKGTELESLITTNKVGMFSEADDAEGMTKNIISMYKLGSDINEYKQNASEYVKNNSSRQGATNRYISEIKSIVKAKA